MVLIWLVILLVPTYGVHIYETFHNPLGRDKPFEKMVIDRKNTGRVYLGGVDSLYELMPSLKERTRVITGPQEDNPNCPSATGSCEESRQPTPSYTKALAIYGRRSKLVECTSLFQGRCRLRNLYDITSPKEPKESSAVVANDRESSTVVFVAPGPPNPAEDDVLYVASTFADNGRFRDEVPAVVSLKLDEKSLFTVAHKTVNSETQMEMERSYRRSYKIKYVSGFTSGNFSYFVSTQPKLATGISAHHSKLIRLCHGDKFYHSYTEVPLQCTKGNVDYNLVQDAYVAKPGFDLARELEISVEMDVLFAVFSKGEGGQEMKTPGKMSALCVYSMRAVEEKFLENIQLCNKGSVLKGLEWFSRGTTCSSTKFPEGHDVTCGIEVNYPIGGSVPVRSAALFTTNQAQYTAVASKSVHSYTVVFVGTRDGRLVKGVVESPTNGFEYQTIEVHPGRPILADMDWDISGEYLFVMTPETVKKVKSHECQLSERCSECLAAKDPFCGWCSLENRCSVREQCNDRGNTHWLPYKESRCTTIRSVTPDKIQITSAAYLELLIDNLPAISGQLSCVFTVGSEIIPLGASRQGNKVQCPTPQTSLLPSIPRGEHSIVASLAVQVDQGPDFASTNFTFFDCSTYKTCTQCTQSDFACDWCTQTHVCTTNAEDTCRRQRIINGINRRGPSGHKGPSFCPHIVSTNPDIFVPSGTSEEIRVQAKNILDFQENFHCLFTIDHSVHRKKARREGEFLICEPMQFIYYGAGLGNGTDVAQLDITWAKGKMLDNSQGVRVVMYKCESLADNCGLCLTLDAAKFTCGWCTVKNTCTRTEQCPKPADEDAEPNWLDPTKLCPNPVITDFWPTKGPIAGGTELTVNGVNLGRKFEDIDGTVRVNNRPCQVLRDRYVVSRQIVCVTPATSAHSSNPIIIQLKKENVEDFTTTSTSNFYYEDPVISAISPVRGPQSGGTDVTIRGQHLDAGSHVSATIAGVNCSVGDRSNTVLVCRTGMSSSLKGGAVVVKFDWAIKHFLDVNFNYDPDPVISSVRPETSIESGGLHVEVRGERLNLIQRPRMILRHQGNEILGPLCSVVSEREMNCVTPAMKRSKKSSQPSQAGKATEVDFGFELDAVDSQRNLPAKLDSTFKKLIVFPDPAVYPFEDGLKYFRPDDYLTIKGDSLNEAAAERDVRVRIGSDWCNLTALAPSALTCRPPSERPEPLSEQKAHPEVVVLIGNSKQYVGDLSYDTEGPAGPLSIEVIGAIAAAVAIFVIAIIGLLIAYRRKSTRHTRQMKSLHMQMTAIEVKVANECKEAFAELQTSMSELNHEVTSVGIPFLSYKDYVTGVLFPNSINHPVLRELEVEPERAASIEKGLRQLNQLLLNKTFVLLLIRVMEANKYFLSKDRVYVGSLLMLILQEKMEYCTDVLKTLLAELIERTVERRYQPKILFRRSESVAERMLAAWFTFLMHRYLVECAGRPLFMLYWAMKQQIEKGPHDAVTHEARYSLSEEKLLRSTFDFHDLIVFVSVEGSSMETPVRVLDCDTITQVKDKCLDAFYRTTPYSRRPSANDLDLEWRTGVSGRLVLQDMDVTTKGEPGGWKRLNTLAHYKVPHNSSLALVPRQASMYNLSLMSERSEKSSTFSLKNSPTLSRAFSPQTKDPESGYKLYHLVKLHDQGGGPDPPADKLVSEIYLTRLLTMKGTLQKFIEDLLEAIFSTAHRGSTLPLCVKYMFDFMDEQALLHGIQDPEVVHAWKSNALPLRFWVNLIKNPQFLFDIPRPVKIEGSLSVVAQTLMDACSTQDHQLTKDSPSSKLLFARDIGDYRDWVDRYYHEISSIPACSDQDMNAFLAEESRAHQQSMHVYSALNELYKYLEQYKEQLVQALEEDEFSRRSRLPMKLAQMLACMESNH